MPEPIRGLELCRRFYIEIVQPILEQDFSNLPHSAALLGHGSEVLGFDDETSQDHDWGPRVQIFLNENDFTCHNTVLEALDCQVPSSFMGYPVDFTYGEPAPRERARHNVRVYTLRSFIRSDLNFDLDSPLEPADWLTFPSQKLRTITAGAVYRDEVGLQSLRDKFAYYPGDVWLYLMASGWGRIAQEEHLMGRSGMVGDEIGSAIIASRLVRDMMRLCFLMERQYAPYPKWFGTAFGRLACAQELSPIIRKIQLSPTWEDREEHFEAAWERLGMMHNELGITPAVQMKYINFHTRKCRVLNSGEFVESLRSQIKDPAVSRLPLIGGIDQISDSTDILDYQNHRPTLRKLYY